MRREGDFGAAAAAQTRWPVLPLTCLALFAVLVSGGDVQSAYGKTSEDILQAAGTAIAVYGGLLRFTAAGWPDGRERRTALHSVLLDPMLTGGIFIALGLSIATQVWWFSALVAIWAGFRLAVARRGAGPAQRELPLVFPRLSGWQTPARPFSWKHALLHETGTVYVIVALTVVLEVSVDLRTGYATAQNWPGDWPLYFAAFATASVAYLLVPQFAGNRPVPQSLAPSTRGLLVQRRAGLVDTLENLISGGQQEAILDATLDAATLRPGEKLLDVGCGSGKLAIAAARLTGPAGAAYGIDATPAMIELARERARNTHSNAEFRIGVAERLPFADGELQAVTSSYFFHHLPSDVKAEALREMWRVLAPGGRLVITDYGTPQTLAGYIASIPMRFDFHEYVRPQLRGELEEIVRQAGIGQPEILASFLGYINVLRIVKA